MAQRSIILVIVSMVCLILSGMFLGRRVIFNVGASNVASELFGVWASVSTNKNIPHQKYQFKPRLSPWFISHALLFYLL